MITPLQRAALSAVIMMGITTSALADKRVELKPDMVTHDREYGNPDGLVDEQALAGDPPAGKPTVPYAIPSEHRKDGFPISATIDLGESRALSRVWLYDTNGKGDVTFSAGTPDNWKELTTFSTDRYQQWREIPLEVETRYLQVTMKDAGANFNEIVLYAYEPQEWADVQAQRAQAAQAAAERDAAIAKAQEEAKNRPKVELETFGQVTLVDEIDVATAEPGHMFAQSPEDASRIETILGQPTRVLNKTPGEGAYMTFRIGRHKLLEPGATYVLEVEYPEDAPRSMIVLNAGNETARGFHTGTALGDAFHPKYVNNNNESLNVPLSGKHEKWQMLFNLHDRFPELGFIRGIGDRGVIAEEGFNVTIAQYSAENIPMSQGAAVSRIRLYQVPNREQVNLSLRLPPEGLPQRRIFWREEMADGVLSDTKDETKRGLKEPLDWYRFKANQMEFLGMRTYTKDLLEFGAVQHWDSTPGGGNRWAFHNADAAPLWGQIVQLMGERGFDVMPYYEYAGSKGQQGLGNQRRAKPLTRDDAYTHIKWIENANADITDPDTYADFKKMLDITIIQFKDKANFAGAWLRPRSQLPISFADATRKRFAEEANGGTEVTRKQLIDDQTLLNKYKQWWFGKRREFLVAMRDHLRENGVKDATILYTASPKEPGVSFPFGGPNIVTDDVAAWKEWLAANESEANAKINPASVEDVVGQELYLKALTAPLSTWGGWEVQHANPESDPANYKETEGVLLTHAYNRLYTVSDPKTFDAFRSPAGLAVMRHYSLNENMMYDKEDKPKLGYFVADIERAGPYCMMGEAMAMANGDPTHLGYLVGLNWGRGFPEYVRNFNQAFMALPALPSERLNDASSDDAVVVRSIKTEGHGTYVSVVNTAMTDKKGVQITLPAGKVTDASTGEAINAEGGKVTLEMYPYQLRALHVQ
ncbi:MAG TPA: hypothetical protein VGN72_04030 [Tepidisphaeraceae bacterium]|nr:hypothetical protein [Tepidisphaeraceae bacterium]